MVHALRRAGFPLEEIQKLTGHKSLETLSSTYNFKIDNKDRVDMAAAIAFGPELSRGGMADASGKF